MNNPEARAIEVINPAAVDTPEVKLGDRVAFDAFGRRVVGVVTRWDEDGITIQEERW